MHILSRPRPSILNGLLLLLALSCSVQAAERELVDVEAFNAITVSGGIDVRLRQGDKHSVVINTMLGSTNDVLADIGNGKLTLSRKSSTFFFFLQWFAHYRVDVTMPELTNLHASGGSNVDAQGVFTGENIRLMTSGGSDTRIEVDTVVLELESSGGSDLTLRGKADRAVITVSGGSDLHASRFEVREAEIEAGGGSDVEITVTESLTANISGGSDLSYGGEPRYTNIDASGGADASAR